MFALSSFDCLMVRHLSHEPLTPRLRRDPLPQRGEGRRDLRPAQTRVLGGRYFFIPLGPPGTVPGAPFLRSFTLIFMPLPMIMSPGF